MASDSETKLRDLRLNLAEICLDGREERIAALCRNPAGDALLTMIHSGVRHLAMTKNDQAVAERCHRILSVEHDIGRKVAAYLALNLFTFPHGIDRAFDIVDVPTPLIATVVKAQLAVPMFFTRDGARRRALAHVEATVQEIHKAATVIDEPDFRREILTGFMDGYNAMSIYGEDVSLKVLAQRRASLIRLYLETYGMVRDTHVAGHRPHPQGLIRLGVLCPGAFSETAALRGHLKGLDRSEFEITAFVPDEAASSVSAGFEDLADDFISLPVADLPHAAEIVAQQKVDILMAGANLTNSCRFPWTLLMAQRLAPLQVAMHASNLTTGLTTVDVYLNGALNEPPDAQNDYTEELVLFPGSSNRYVLPGAPIVPAPVSREQIGVPDAVILAVTGANFFKIGPDLVDAWARILEGVPTAHLLMYPFNPNWTTHYPHKDGFLRFLQDGFAARGVGIERLHVLEAQSSRAPILGVLGTADLYLDSFPYSGAVSLVDPLTMGCPPIVREGQTARCRQSAGLLRDLGLDVMVTRTT
jgi:predicted O-linked N-acetylglucosamine transferase (SPINDLY family)